MTKIYIIFLLFFASASAQARMKCEGQLNNQTVVLEVNADVNVYFRYGLGNPVVTIGDITRFYDDSPISASINYKAKNEIYEYELSNDFRGIVAVQIPANVGELPYDITFIVTDSSGTTSSTLNCTEIPFNGSGTGSVAH